MSKKNAAPSNENSRCGETNLDSRYGEIGISAVAAALRFKSAIKNPAYAPVAPQIDEERVAETTA